MDRRVNYLLQIINKRQQSSPAIFRKLTKNKKREIWLKLRILVHCDYGDDHREIWKSNVGCMSPTRDTGLFIMSESLLKNALGANHQDINGKRSKPPQLQQERVRESAAAYSEDSLPRRPNKSSQTWTTFWHENWTNLASNTYLLCTVCVSSSCCLLNSDCAFSS